MSKRKVNVFNDETKNNSYSDESNTGKDYDSENDQPVNKKIRRTRNRTNKRFNDTEQLSNEKKILPRENGEHSYSCIPLFANVSKNYKSNEIDNSSDGYYDSDDQNGKYSLRRRISERSTSPESYKSNKEKSIFDINSQNSKSKRKAKCFTKNAVMARMNRQRKKEYLSNLEENVESLKENNNDLKTKLSDQQDIINSLKNEVKYLKSVISNSKEIGVLLRRLCCDKSDTNMKITSSLLNTPSSQNEGICSSDDFHKDVSDLDWSLSPNYDVGLSEMDNILQCDIPPADLTDFESVNPYGVCLHVANKQVSLEFCASCSQNASSVLNGDIYSSVK